MIETDVFEQDTTDIADAILKSPTGEIDDNTQPVEGYIHLGTNAMRGYRNEYNRTRTT